MPNILLTRVDNRLIHGQVANVWTHSIGTNLIVVANDEVANDKFQQDLLSMSAQVDVRFFSIQQTIDVIHKASDSQLIFIVCSAPQDVLKLVKGGVPIDKLNIGNMHFSEGKKQIHKTVSVDENDIETFKELLKLGVECTIQRGPEESKIDIQPLL